MILIQSVFLTCLVGVAAFFVGNAHAADLWGEKPEPDVVCKTADETFAVYESIERNGNKSSSAYTGKIVKIENCWFNPLSNQELCRDADKEGVYVMCFRQGGRKWAEGTVIGHGDRLYVKKDVMGFFIESGAQAQGLKDVKSFLLDEAKKHRRFESEWSNYDFYFAVVDRPSKTRDWLTQPCAKLIYFEAHRPD